jgi:NAD-dependent DNA ligase
MAAQLPSIDTKGKEVEKAFSTPLEMCLATRETWAKIPGIGVKLSSSIVELLQGKNKA